mgnify:FL=1
MNLLLPKVLSDITGKTGMKIIRAIVDGEHDPIKLAQFRDPRVRKSEEEIAEALRGDYRPELLFVLKMELEQYDFIISKLRDFDREVLQRMKELTVHCELNDETREENEKDHRRYRKRNAHVPDFDVRSMIHERIGIDLLAVPSFSSLTTLGLIFEVGIDMSKWPTEKHFASWLGLSPHLRVSGGKTLGSRTKKCACRAARFFRQAASTLRSNKSYLGDFYRRMRSRHGESHAITATAHKLAIIFYKLLKNREPFRELDRSDYEQAVHEQRIRKLVKRAQKLGFELTATTDTAKAALHNLEQYEAIG